MHLWGFRRAGIQIWDFWMLKMSDTGNHNESSPIPNSVETVIPKPSKPCVTLQAICERCVYFAVQRIFPRRGSMTRSHPQPSPFGSVHVLQLGTIKQGFLLNISVKILDLTLVLIWPLPESIIFSKNAWWCNSSDLMIYTVKQEQTLLSLIERCWNFDMLTFTDVNVIFPVIEFWVVASQNMDLFRFEEIVEMEAACD